MRVRVRLRAVELERRLDLLRGGVDVRAGQVDLVEHGQHAQLVAQGELHVGDRLRLDAL